MTGSPPPSAPSRPRFPGGIVAGWYPIKHLAPVRTLHEGIRLGGVRDVVATEIWLREPTSPLRLNGCGLLVRPSALALGGRVAADPGRAADAARHG